MQSRQGWLAADKGKECTYPALFSELIMQWEYRMETKVWSSRETDPELTLYINLRTIPCVLQFPSSSFVLNLVLEQGFVEHKHMWESETHSEQTQVNQVPGYLLDILFLLLAPPPGTVALPKGHVSASDLLHKAWHWAEEAGSSGQQQAPVQSPVPWGDVWPLRVAFTVLCSGIWNLKNYCTFDMHLLFLYLEVSPLVCLDTTGVP